MRRAPTRTLLSGAMLGLLVVGVSLGVLAMHQVPHAPDTVSVAQQHEGHHGPSQEDGPAHGDTMTHMCVGLIVVITGLVGLALVALVRREHEGLPRPSALRWLRSLPSRAPPLRLTLSELCVLRL
ncbi:hypothetical protein [Allokutzneria oryzae]|uniref:Uncharacterized protein n=1 Tax=Allokutzneria oryzae TaxID=1378989 RepID=A0ABV5ZY45_9PSEU